MTPIEALSFTVRPAATHEDLLSACCARAEAYGYKIPEYRERMAHPDPIDLSPWTTVYLCEDKIEKVAVGTMRVQMTRPGVAPLEIEKYAQTPEKYARLGRAEITRLAAIPGAHPRVRLALWKAAYLHCREHDIRFVVIGARKPSLIRAYEKMGYTDISGPIALPYAGNLPHRIMAADIAEAEVFWRESQHPMLAFMAHTNHPDIDILPSMQSTKGNEILGVV